MTKFCQKVYEESDHFKTPDSIEICRNDLGYEVVKSFWEWSCQKLKFKKALSLFTYAKAWRIAVANTHAPR